MTRPELFRETLPTPIGDIILVTDADGALRLLNFFDEGPRAERLVRRAGALEAGPPTRPTEARRALAAYFGGDIAAIDTLPVATAGTPFQESVWSALRTIPAGEMLSYGALAARIGRPTAVRAVGLANGSNPVGVVNPCHRVIGADGSLTGYGGGLARKSWLLAHEGAGSLPVKAAKL